MTKDMNLALGGIFTLLKTNLATMVELDKTGNKFLLLPTKIDSPTPVTLEEMIADFKSAFGMKEEDLKKIESSLNAFKKEDSNFDVTKITFQLQTAFFYKDMSAAQSTAGNDKNPPAETENANQGITEYAFAISVDTSNALPDLGFVKLNSLFFAVWNTEREAVLRQIGTGNITKMLANLND